MTKFSNRPVDPRSSQNHIHIYINQICMCMCVCVNL